MPPSKFCLFIVVSCSLLTQVGLCSQAAAQDQSRAQSTAFLKNVPRYGGVSGVDKSTIEDTDQLMAWVIGIASVAAACMLPVVLGMVVYPFWFCCRCYACCCCKRTKRTEPLTTMQRWGPFTFIVLCTMVIVIFAGLGYGANLEFSTAVVDDETGLLDIAGDLFQDTLDFIDLIVVEPLAFIGTQAEIVITTVQEMLSDTSVINTGTATLSAMMANISSKYDSKTLNGTAPNGTVIIFECEFCKTIATEMNATRHQLDTQTATAFATMSDTVTTVNDTLVGAKDMIISSVTSVEESVATGLTPLNETHQSFLDLKPQIVDYNAQRELAYNILFALPMVPFIFVILGGFCRKEFCFTINYSCLWLVWKIMFILLAIHITVALFLNDACVFLEANDDDLSSQVGGQIGTLVQSCLDNTSLLEAFNLTEQLNFTNVVSFDDVGALDLTGAFDLAALSDFGSNMTTLDVTTFHGAGNNALHQLNSAIADLALQNNNVTYTRENYTNCTADIASFYFTGPINFTLADNSSLPVNPTDVYRKGLYDGLFAGCNATIEVLAAEASIISQAQTIVEELQNDTAALQLQVSVIGNDTDRVLANLTGAGVLLDPLFNKTNFVIQNARCGFIGKAYFRFKGAMCTDILGSLAMMVTSMLVIACFAFVSCCCSVKMVRRIEADDPHLMAENSAIPQPQQNYHESQFYV